MNARRSPPSPPSGADALNCEAVHAFGVHREAWDHLVDASALPTPFLKSWWIDNAGEGETLMVLCLDPDGRLIGGAAFERDELGVTGLRVGRLRSIGQGVLAPDHLDVVAKPSDRLAVTATVARWLHRSGCVVDLDGLTEDCLFPRLLAATVLDTVPAPFLDLDGLDPDNPLARLPGRLRSTIKRTGKRLAKAGFSVRKVDDTSTELERSAALDALFTLHDSRWQDSSALSGGSVRLRNALASGLAVGGAVIHELADDHTVIASEVELIAGSRACFYQAGRLTDHEFRGSGSVLKEAVLRWALESSMTEFDLLRGTESYKDDWTATARGVVRMRTGTGPITSLVSAGLNGWTELAPAVARLRGGASQSTDLSVSP